MKLKLMNCMDEEAIVEIPDNPEHVDITVLSGDEILEAFYLSGNIKKDINNELGKQRSIDMFDGRHTLISKKNGIDFVEQFNNRSKQKEEWWNKNGR